MDRKMVNFIKEQYPPGTRIRLNSMEDPYAPIAPGTEGVVDFVDDIGTIHMKWNNGRSLGIVPGEDSFSVLPPKLTTFKLYMPLTAELYEISKYGDLESEGTELDGGALRSYQDQIMAELIKSRMPEETERGLMYWYGKADSINTKVHSAVFTVEERDRQLWGVAECRVAGALSAAELDTLKKYITGQAADGWGEHFEQCEILVDGGSELYVSGTPTIGVYRRSRNALRQSWQRGCRSCVSPPFPVPVLSFASNEARAATTPVIGTQMTPRRTVNWRTTTTNALALHLHRRRP